MKQTLIRFSLLIIFAFLGTGTLYAKIRRVAIVNVIDTTLIHNHLGVTIFTNKIDTFACQLSCKDFIDMELSRYLNEYYEVSYISMPDSLRVKVRSINNEWGYITKAAKPWILGLRDKYDLVIYVENVPKSNLSLKNVVLQSNGLYTAGSIFGIYVYAYSTISFTAINTRDLDILDYEQGLMKYIIPIRKNEYFGNKIEINPIMLPLIKSKLENLMDSQIEYFLTNSGLITKGDFAIMKSKKAE